MIALLVAAFILYLYTPHLLFKFAAATKFDFITRKELPQVEEFFAAGLPSLFLNGLTFVALWLAYWIVGEPPIVLDRAAAAAVFTKDPDLSQYFRKADLAPLLCYVGSLTFISWWAGRIYGGIIRKVAIAGGEWEYLEAATVARRPWLFDDEKPLPGLFRAVLFLWRLIVMVPYRRSWRIFYSQYEEPLYPVVIRNSYAFVHTTYGLYHGILFQLTKKRDGDALGITLIAVSKFSRRKEEDCLRLGVNPISGMSGPLFIKWDEIIDINYPPNAEVLDAKREFYAQKLRAQVATATKRRVRFGTYARFQNQKLKREAGKPESSGTQGNG